MSHRDVPVPERIARNCKLDPRGFPVTYVTFIHPQTREPDFRIVNETRVRLCVAHRLCGICGEEIGRTVAFVGGPESVANRVFSDPPMHEECARYALTVCPFLASPRGRHRPIGADETGGVEVAKNPLTGTERPEKIALYLARSYELVMVAARPGDTPVPAIRVAPAARLVWFD